MKRTVFIMFLMLFLHETMRKGQIMMAVVKNNEAIAFWMKSQRKKDIGKVIHLLKESIAIDSTYKLAYINTAQFTTMLGEIKEAINVLELAIKHFPADANLYFVKGVLLAKLNEKDLSDEMFGKSITLFDKEFKETNKSSLLSSKAIAHAFKGDKNLAIIELLAAQNFFYDITFNPFELRMHELELEYISKFDRNRQIKEFWDPSFKIERNEFIIDYDR